ncbi:MAG: sel1 repeat family protein [Labilithrix sp.]|nr:sel1 repeat family protein [Labilithrix sp.]
MARSAPFVAVFVLGLAACGSGAAPGALRPAAPTASEALGLAKCSTADEPQLLTLDWKDTQRIDLERAMENHVAVVHYDCAGLHVLRDCAVAGGYEYASVSPAKTAAKLQDAEEVRANLPFGGVDVGGMLARGSTIDIVYLAVGQQATTVHDVPAEKLVGSCEGATHTVRAANLGAFALTSGTRGEANAATSLLGKGASASTSSSNAIQRVNGDLDACHGDANKTPPPRCKALLQLLLSRISSRADGPRHEPVAKGAARRERVETLAIKNPCSDGLVFSKEGLCTRTEKATAFMCDAASFSVCEAQCAKGDGRSCYNAAANRVDSNLSGLSTRGWGEAFVFLDKSCAAGNAAGCGDLGVMLETGRGVQRNQERAEHFLVKACTMGDAASCNHRARALSYGDRGFRADPRAARQLFDRGCALGSHEACREAARMSVEGIGGPRDIAAATRLLERSCAGGNDDNCRLGRYIANTEASLADEGESVTLATESANVEGLKNPCKSTLRVDDRAMRCAKAEAGLFVCDVTDYDECVDQCDKGNARSCWQAAANRMSSSNPNSATRGREEAFPWLEKGCRTGHAPSCTAFAGALLWGRGTAANPERGRAFMQKACDMRDAHACKWIADKKASEAAPAKASRRGSL